MVLVITEPAEGSVFGNLNDGGTAVGVQTDVAVQSSLRAGDLVTFRVRVGAATTTAGTVSVDELGTARLDGITIPTGDVVVSAAGQGSCGEAEASIHVRVIDEVACAVELDPAAAANDHYAPLGVYDAEADVAPAPGMQVDLVVRAEPGAAVVPRVGGTELDEVTTGDDGAARVAIDLPEGESRLSARCATADGAASGESGETGVWVDLTAPACELVAPAPGEVFIPDDDADGDPRNGTQVDLVGRISSPQDDVAGEPAEFTSAAVPFSGTPVGGDGATFARVTAASPGIYAVGLTGRDHAGNRCGAEGAFHYETEGCAIAIASPTELVASDTGPDPGVQTLLAVDVDPACVGRAIATDCDATGPRELVVPPSGHARIEITVCAQALCEASYACGASVSNGFGIVTSAGALVRVDTQPPSVLVAPAIPAGLACGGTVDMSNDAGAEAGLQIVFRVAASEPVSARRLSHAAGGGDPVDVPLDALGTGKVTIAAGENLLVGEATDLAGHTSTAQVCTLARTD